jgi:hypothetical protein
MTELDRQMPSAGLVALVRPAEVARALRRAGPRIEDLTVWFTTAARALRLSRDPAVNYLLLADRS